MTRSLGFQAGDRGQKTLTKTRFPTQPFGKLGYDRTDRSQVVVELSFDAVVMPTVYSSPVEVPARAIAKRFPN